MIATSRISGYTIGTSTSTSIWYSCAASEVLEGGGLQVKGYYMNFAINFAIV